MPWAESTDQYMDVYLEGGSHLRRPMTNFLRRAVGSDIPLKILPCRDRDRAVRLFSQASSSDSLLLIDSEGDDLITLRRSVVTRTGHPNAVDRIFFMVQLMEAWFLADRQSLVDYYGQGFNTGRLPGNRQPEQILKRDVEQGLRDATAGTIKGAYDKTDHAVELFAQLNPATVYDACPNFARLIDFLRGDAGVSR